MVVSGGKLPRDASLSCSLTNVSHLTLKDCRRRALGWLYGYGFTQKQEKSPPFRPFHPKLTLFGSYFVRLYLSNKYRTIIER